MQKTLFIAFCLVLNSAWCQFKFSGYVYEEATSTPIYLSIVEDYRKLSSLNSEQIIAKTTADSDGYFEFKGNYLENKNRIYRIHIEQCTKEEKALNNFNGQCKNGEYLLFIAKNTDSINLPFSFGKQIFCEVESSNPKSNALVKIDSLKEVMRFAYSEVNSQASKKLNNKKWFQKLQEFGKNLNEPLAELYIYAYLSDRSGDLHNHYVKDLKSNEYYENLKNKLQENYPDLSLTNQYINELNADSFKIKSYEDNDNSSLYILIIIVSIFSISLNIFLLLKFKKQRKQNTKNLIASLSKQEQVVLQEILQNKSNKVIAESLFLSVSTVKTHINNIYKKLNVQSRDEVKKLFSN